MIDLVLDLLRMDEWRNESEEIDIAKGKYEIPLTIKQAWIKNKRWQRQ